MPVKTSIKALYKLLWSNRQQKKYHLIHIPKNGGVAVRSALELRGNVSLSRPYHYRYRDIVNQLDSNLRFFSIVRNPWSRTASRYMFARQTANKWPTDDPRRLFVANATFERFVRERPLLPIPEHPGQPWMGPLSSWFNQLEWIVDERGNVACDCLRLEHLERDLSEYFGIPLSIPRRNVTQETYDYRSMYTDELIEIVADIFRDDIEYFGFDFEGSATRNISIPSPLAET